MDSIPVNSPLGRLAAHLQKLEDPRRLRRPVHLFSDILIIGLCSFFIGGRTFVDMEDCAAALEPWLRTFLELPGGLPSHDTFNRVFAALDSRGMEDVLRLWTSELTIPMESADQPPPALRHLALDGKVLRGSRDGSGSGAGAAPRARAVVNLWLADHGLVLAQRKIPQDCGESVQAPLLLRHIALKNTVVTADAAHARTGTAAEIIGLGGDYLLCVKGNQAATRDAILTALDPAIAALPEGHFHSVDKEHGRLEERRAWVCSDLSDFGPRGLWKGLGAVAVVESRFENLITGKTSVDRRCFITSLSLPQAGGGPKGTASARDKAMAGLVARLARGHWKVENSLHWRLDVLMGEDACRARKGEAAINLAVMRRITLNVLKAHTPFSGKRGERMSVRSRQFVASISPDYLRSLIEATPLTT